MGYGRNMSIVRIGVIIMAKRKVVSTNKNYTICVVNDVGDSLSDMFFDAGYNIVSISDTQLSNPLTPKDHTFLSNQRLKMQGVDLLCFAGGTDINPAIYGQNKSDMTDNPDNIRDFYEIMLWKEARRTGIPCVGICRGAQLLNALSGGTLDQHNDEHQSGHAISILGPTGDANRWVYAPANHHQIMEPSVDADILAKCQKTNKAEVLYYEHSKSLCHQPHPEWVAADKRKKHGYYDYFFRHIKQMVEGWRPT